MLVACGVWVGLDVSPGSVVGRAAGTSIVQGEVQLVHVTRGCGCGGGTQIAMVVIRASCRHHCSPEDRLPEVPSDGKGRSWWWAVTSAQIVSRQSSRLRQSAVGHWVLQGVYPRTAYTLSVVGRTCGSCSQHATAWDRPPAVALCCGAA